MKGRLKFSTHTLQYYLDNKSSFLSSLKSSKQTSSIISNHHINTSLSKEAGIGFPDYKGEETNITLERMMAASLHLGHSPRKTNQHMMKYIWGTRSGINIIDLDKTLICLRQAAQLLRHVSSRGGRVLWIGTSPSIQQLTYECANAASQFYINTKWISGTLTNRSQVIRNSSLLPDLIVLLDPMRNRAVLSEAFLESIPTIAICDTPCDPREVTYPIPANDDAFSSIAFISRTLSHASMEGSLLRSGDEMDSHNTIMSNHHRFKEQSQ